MVQWLKVSLQLQGTWVRSLVQESPTCHEAPNPHTATTNTSEPKLDTSTREAAAVRKLYTKTKNSPTRRNGRRPGTQQLRPAQHNVTKLID